MISVGRMTAWLALIVLVASQTACVDWLSQQDARGRVAVLDLDRLAAEVGFKTQIQATLKEVEAGLNRDLASARDRAQQGLVERRKQYGQAPTTAQQRELRAVAEQSRRELIQLRGASAQSLASRRELYIAQLKDHIRNIATEVAAERGMEVVLLRTTNMLAATPSSDITQAVIASVRERAPKLSLSATK